MLKKFNQLTYSDVYYGAIFLMLIFPFMPIVLNNYFVLVPAVVALLAPFFTPRYKFCNPSFMSLLISSSFILLLISSFYSDNAGVALNELMKRLSLIIFPVIFFLRKTPLLIKYREQYEYTFIGIIVIFFTWKNIELFIFFNKIINEGLLVNSWIDALQNSKFQLFYRNYFIEFTGIHPTYASLYSLFGSGVLIINLFRNKYSNSIKTKALVYLVLFILLIYSFLLAAKGPLLAFVVSIIVILFLALNKKYFSIVGSVLILFFSIVILTFPPLRARVIEIVEPANNNSVNSVSVRKIIHSNSWDLIKSNCLFGVGIGDVQDKLDEGFEKYKQKEIKDFTLNTHNEYFNHWASAGILGLLAIVLTLVIPLVKAIRQKDYKFLFFLLFIIISFFFENILSRQKGVLFFVFFYSIYFFNQIDQSKCQQDIPSI